MPEVKIAKGAEDNGLATMLSDLIRQNLEQKPEKIKSFDALSTSVGISAPDIEVDVTLKFNKGNLTIHDGIVGKPSFIIIADSDNILGLSLIKIKCGLPYYFDAKGREIVKKLLSGKIKIKGMLTNIVDLTRVTKVVSVN